MTTTDPVVSPSPGCAEMPCFSGNTVIRDDVASGANAVVIRDVAADCIVFGASGWPGPAWCAAPMCSSASSTAGADMIILVETIPAVHTGRKAY